MARLNEVAPANDALETLRRKFLRQNRDIARDNSTKSLRIRNLENEVSRLLAENLGYREQVAHLQNKSSTSRNQRILNHVNEAKSRLEAQILEFGVLISTLGDVPSHTTKASAVQHQPVRTAGARSPAEKKFRNMCTMSETVAAQEGRLPPIREDKMYPRRTLDRAEILAIAPEQSVASADSPEIGTPPVSQFVNQDPAKIDLPSTSGPEKTENEEQANVDSALSINLEHRRKRKDTLGTSEPKRASRFEQGAVPAESSVKLGAKRKLSVREDEDTAQPVKAPSSADDFKFTRRNVDEKGQVKPRPAPNQDTPRNIRELATARGVSQVRRAANTHSEERKVLRTKSSNVDIVNSPKKATKASLLECGGISAKSNSNEKTLSSLQGKRQDILKATKPSIEETTKIIDVPIEYIEPEPETPAALELFSPPSTGPPTSRAESRDTPPPTDLGPGMEAQRPSRRARAAVSYAEPNLRDKMRRPTKDLIDAVTGEVKSGRAITNPEGIEMPKVIIKGESNTGEDAWKMPSAASVDVYSKSPLVNRTNLSDSKDVPIQDLDPRKRGIMQNAIQIQAEPEASRSASSSAISAFITGSRKIKLEPVDGQDEKTMQNAMAQLDIYEFRGSSPMEKTADNDTTIREDRQKARALRRQSSTSQDIGHVSDSGASDTEGPRRTISLTSRRRTSALAVGGSSTKPEGLDSKTDGLLKRTNSTTALADNTRGERAAGRRRSMML